MKFKSLLALPLARYVRGQIRGHMGRAVQEQDKLLQYLLREAGRTAFGQDHRFPGLRSAGDFRQAVPIRDYEAFRPYIDKIRNGESDILWKGRPLYFAKTSGTTSGVKYIPITQESMPDHIKAARNALLCYIAETGNAAFADGKMIFLSGSPELEKVNGILTGRLSGIVNHHVPAYLRRNQLPSFATNCLEDWESKLDAIVQETLHCDMRLISGIPPWMQMYFDRLQKVSRKSVGELFPNLSVIVHGGVNFKPYRTHLLESIGRRVDTIETFPASEGFFAFQDSQHEEGLLLNTWSGLYYEFVPAGEIFNDRPTRLSLAEVQTGVQYALLVSSNAGLWAYNIGDTIRFVSTNPFRIVVTGRIKHFISAFGEHVIGEEVEYALLSVAARYNLHITEFTVAPIISAEEGKSGHEWFVEFAESPDDPRAFAREVDEAMCRKNMYYRDLIEGKILHPLRLRIMRPGAFVQYMKSIGKLGGQNKVPRLSNDRQLADALRPFIA